ncbi:PD-(D/E)XK nuclease family transposase [Moorella thermoacetica]|uniref:PD-(D/E)XK nuclease family transposase n=1 Tax=Neomoorella thermoacetica TaxID=1525 RepID=A0A1J5NSF7_NEOTH|nr:PD-(D/E)XK nuclease family transposase [Moorella thermoacetica]
MRDDETGERLCDDLEIHFLELEKIKAIKRRPKNALEAWMMYLNNLEGKEMEAITMENPGIRKALTIEKAFWQSEKEHRLYELREKAMRDEISALAGQGRG